MQGQHYVVHKIRSRVCGRVYKCNPQTSPGGDSRQRVPREAPNSSQWGQWFSQPVLTGALGLLQAALQLHSPQPCPF